MYLYYIKPCHGLVSGKALGVLFDWFCFCDDNCVSDGTILADGLAFVDVFQLKPFSFVFRVADHFLVSRRV